MKQITGVVVGARVVQVELPPRAIEVMPGLRWGSVDAFPTPAYWLYQVLARRITGTTISYRLGNSLIEEVSACLLGGHGIPSAVGVAAYRRLQKRGMLAGVPSEAELLDSLSQPLDVGDRSVRYRFARQKARYLASALQYLHANNAPTGSGRMLRDWLLDLPGIGPKTASWVARNWLDADDIAILDIHVLRAGALGGFLDAQLNVTRHYQRLEEEFLRFSGALGVRASELDAVIWSEMMTSSATVRRLLVARTSQKSTASADERCANAH